LILVDSGDGLEVSCPASSSSLSLLSLQRPSVLSESGGGVSTSGAGAFLLVVGHPSTSSAESVGFSMAFTEGGSTSAHL
jgi:hypothetical protein